MITSFGKPVRFAERAGSSARRSCFDIEGGSPCGGGLPPTRISMTPGDTAREIRRVSDGV